MIRRHPHVFAVSAANTPDSVKLQWDQIKAEEKRERAERRARRGITEDFKAGFLGGVQRSQPALTEALKLQEQAARVGFDWSDPAPFSTRSRRKSPNCVKRWRRKAGEGL